MAEPTRRWFFVPARDGAGWDLVEATRTGAGWELRRPGRIAQDVVPEVPPKGADWKEVKAPERPPKVPKPPAPPKPSGPRIVEAPEPVSPQPGKAGTRERPARPVRMPKVPVVKAPAAPERKPKPPQPKAVPGLSRALEDLLQEEQLRQPAPAGMVKCPVCGLPLAPTKNKKVRTHANPLRGERCPASGTPWSSK